MLRRVLIVPSASISLLTPTDTLLKLSMLCDMAQDQRCKLSNASQASTLPAQPPPPKRFHLAEARHMITLVQVLPRLDHGCSRSIPLALEIAGAFGAIIEVLQILVELLDCPAGGEIVGIGVQAMLISPLVAAFSRPAVILGDPDDGGEEAEEKDDEDDEDDEDNEDNEDDDDNEDNEDNEDDEDDDDDDDEVWESNGWI